MLRRATIIISMILAIAGAFVANSFRKTGANLLPANVSEAQTPNVLTPNTLDELLAIPTDHLANVDIAIMNLLCATQLPGSENLDVPLILQTLDDWAERVKSETERYYPQFQRDPAQYNHSEADYRMLMLITVLQLDLGVHYNMDRVDNPDFRNSKDLFLHGLVNSDNGGTCVSMPVLYVAVGRRLGYPLSLVFAMEHVFCRWEGNGERLNIEGSMRGMESFPDEYYRTWPLPIEDQWVVDGQFLKSLTPQETLADFMASRGHCLGGHGKYHESLKCYQTSAKLMPQLKAYQYFVQGTEALIEFEANGRRIPLRALPDPYASEEFSKGR